MTTTFVDPLGLQATVSAKMGIVSITIASSPIEDIPHDCGWMVALLTPIDSASKARLPSNAAIGDIVEMHVMDSAFTKATVLAPSGEAINGSGEVVQGQRRLFRKVSATLWSALGTPFTS